MEKFMQSILLMVISSCCFAMTTIAIVSYNQLACNTNGMLVFVIAGVFISGIISAYQFIKGFNELFCK